MAGQNIDEQEESCGGITPLIAATFKGHHQAIKLLLAEGANPNEKGGQYRNHGIIRTYIRWGRESDLESYPPSGWPALFYAARQNDIKAIQALLAEGADVNARDDNGHTALIVAADYKASKEVIQALLAEGADVNARDDDGNTPLHRAALNGHTQTIQDLLAEGANINAANTKGNTPLQIAGEQSHVQTIKVLAAQGAITRKTLHAAVAENDIKALTIELAQPDTNVNARDEDGNTALHIAAYMYGRTEATKALLAEGADVNATNRDGYTPLHYAASKNRTEAIKALLANGAHVNATDDNGYIPTPLHIAKRQRYKEAIQLLHNAGAKE